MGREDKIVIYHHSKCSKSCTALHVLAATGLEIERIEYLKNVPSEEELRAIVAKLKCAPHNIIRTTESVYIEKFKGKSLTDDQWIAAMHENPILIQRPIVVKGDYAIVARSADAIEDLISR